jgi:hypothetical protein
MVTPHEKSTQRLHPLNVPWMVARDWTRLVVAFAENENSHVSFDVSVLPSGEEDQVLYSKLPVKRVSIEFVGGHWIKTAPSWSDGEPVDPSRFDWGHVFVLSELPSELRESLLAFRAKWIAEKRCPDPGAYEVSPSEWLAETGATRFKCKHYLIVGHDASCEVLAMGLDWKWESEQVISTDDQDSPA